MTGSPAHLLISTLHAACHRFLQAAGVRRSALLQRAATAVLILTYLATHVGGALYALALHCRSQRIPWRDIPTRSWH